MVGVVFCLVLVCMVYGDNSPVDLDSSGDCADSEDCDVQPKFIVNKKEKYILAVGSKLELKCSLKGGCYESTELDINKLKIIHCKSSSMCSVKDTTVVDNNVCMISFTEDNVTLQDMGTYFCQYNEVNKTRDNIYIRTGYIPFGPQDISCVSNDLENLICNWTMSKEDRNNDIPVNYKSYFKASNLSGQFECQDVEICSLPPLGTGNGGISFNLPNKYTLYINAYNEVGRRLVEYPIDFAKVVKLSPPLVSLNMLEDKSLTLTVKQESEIPLIWIEAIVYQVDYHCSYRSPEMKEVITSENINNVKLTNLIPYTRYTVMVKNKGLNSTGEIYWTSAQPEFYRTKPAAPHSVPSVCGYSIVDDHINIYILPIKKWEKYSKNAAYVVNFTTGSVIDKTFNVSWDIFTIENITSSSGTGFLLELRTVNDVGHSKNTSSLVVPPYETDKLVPMNVIVEGSGKVYNVYWDTVTNDMEKIDVYWCVGQGSKCEGDLNWMSVLPNITKTKVNTDTVDKWIFAVSFVYNDGYTTEMVFSQCYFPDIDKAPNRVVVYSVIPKTRQILVKPGEYCSKKYPSKPLFYHVYYKHSQKDIKLCDQSFFQKRVKATMSKGEITLDKLSPGIDYYICMAVTSSGGSSSISEPEKVQTLPEAENTFKEMIILVVICSAIGTIIVFFVAWKLVKKYKDDDPVIEVPKINKIDTLKFSPNELTLKRYMRGGAQVCLEYMQRSGHPIPHPKRVLLHIEARDLHGNGVKHKEYEELFEYMSISWPETQIFVLPILKRKDIPYSKIEEANRTIKEASLNISNITLLRLFNPSDNMFYDSAHLNKQKGIPAIVKYLKSSMNSSRGPLRGKYTPTNDPNDSQSGKHPQQTPNSMCPQMPSLLKPYSMPQPPPYPIHVPPMQFHPWVWGPFNPQRMHFILQQLSFNPYRMPFGPPAPPMPFRPQHIK